MEEEREEGEIVDVNDDIYENIISDEEDELDLRQRIEELEAKNSELEKIASISKTNDYDLACGTHNFINLVDDDGDDDESYYRLPSKYDYSSYTSRKSRSRRKKTCRHVCKKYKHHKQLPRKASDRRKKPQQSKTIGSSDSSSDDEFQLDRNELKAALKRNTSPIQSSTLKRKLIGITKTVADYIKSKDDVEDGISNNEIMSLLNNMTNKPPIDDDDNESESRLTEQELELRLIALKSAILKKHETRKKRKIIETQPYSPTDTDIVMENVLKANTIVKAKDDLDNMEISPAVSPNIQDGSLQPIDMELESDDENQKPPILNTNLHQNERTSPILPFEEKPNITSKDSQAAPIAVPVPDETSLSIACVPDEANKIKFSVATSLQQQQQEEEDEEQALRAVLLANLKTSKKRVPTNKSPPPEKQPETPLPLEKPISDASMEADHLRKLLLSSVIQKRRNNRHLLPNPFAAVHQKNTAHLPKPMEMTMPQITSNLKEALKRIKERGKQNIDPDAVTNGEVVKEVNNVTVTQTVKNKNASETNSLMQMQCVAALSESIQSHSENVVKNVDLQCVLATNSHPVKMNGDNVSINTASKNAKEPRKEQASTNESVKKSVELSSKTNVVLKNVKCNNAPIECKTTKDTNVPLVISNKNETTLLEKNDSTLRSAKVIAQKKFIAEPQISSLNQKENQLMSKRIATLKRSADEKIVSIAKKAKLSMVKVSKMITTPVEKPVNKMIIQLNNSDSESDDLGLPHRHYELMLNEKSYSGVASPASYSFSPASPMNTIDTKSTDKTTDASEPIQSTTDSFQQQLDEYLKSARTKVEQAKLEVKKPIPKSSSLVSHLPPESQLEYQNLLKRKALLEEKKSQKMEKLKAAQKLKLNGSISVTITNDLFNHQSKSGGDVHIDNTTSSNEIKSEVVTVQKVIISKMHSPTKELSTKPDVTPKTAVTVQNIIISKMHSPTKELSTNPDVVSKTVLMPVGSKSDKPNVPDSPAIPIAAAAITLNTPDVSSCINQSTHSLQNFSALSQDDKIKLLENTESEYMRHSSSYLVDLNKMSSLVCEARLQKEKQFQLESELEELKLKLRQLEQDLIKQKTSVSKLYPVISASHKNIMKKRSKSLQLNKKCYLIGSKVVGADYKIVEDPKAIIAAKIKSLSSQTKLLKNMKKSVEESSSTTSKSIDSSEKISLLNDDNHTAAVETKTTTNNIDSITSEKLVDIQQEVSTIDCILPDIPKEFSKMTIYQSPLEHMKNIDIINPDLIVCPFQLLGQCEDKECTYQHLS